MAAIETSVRASAALDDLYRRYVGDVYRYAYAVLGNHADAEDVTQTTFVNALRALERGEEPRTPSNWLIVIAHNIVRQRWRQAAARPTEVELAHDVPDVSEDEGVELEGLVRALQRIPPSQREALVMRELEGRSYQEIAELLGLTTSALETLLFRARRSLAEELENLVTCQSAELAISRRLDKRLSRKESRRLDEHLGECAACTRLVETQARQRRAFKGLALLPLPIGLALFKGVPTAAAGSVPAIGLATEGTSGLGSATATGGATGGAASGGGVAVGGSLVGGAVAKVAAVLVAGVVMAGAAYEGARLVLDDSGSPTATAAGSAVKGAFAASGAPSLGAREPATASSRQIESRDESVVAPGVAAWYESRAPVEVQDDVPAVAAPGAGDDVGGAPSAPGPGSDTPAARSDPATDGPVSPPEQPATPPPAAPGPSTTPTTPGATTPPTVPGTSKPAKPKKPKRKTTPVGPKAKQPKAPAPVGPGSAPGQAKDKPNGNGNDARPSKPADEPKANGPDAKGQSSGAASDSSPPPDTTQQPPTTAPADSSGAPEDKQPGSDKSGKK